MLGEENSRDAAISAVASQRVVLLPLGIAFVL